MRKRLAWINRHPLLVAFILPIIIMTCYYIGRRVYPFGNSSLLTVDMGQQYIDFYSYFRQTLLGHPGQFFYSFNKAIGGDMFGEFSYYLMSPFNFVLLLFPKTMLDVAVAIMTLLKYGCASLTMAYYLRRRQLQGMWPTIWGQAFALSGWMLANQLNLMWFDVVIWLPLVADGAERLVETKRPWRFIFWLFVAIVTNYYIAYMLILFICGYFGYSLVRHHLPLRANMGAFIRFAASGLLSAGLSAIMLLPTLFQLSQSKGTFTVTKFVWRFEYDPVKLLGKFFAGSFDFSQMPSGQPNIFVGSLALIGFVLYFFLAKIPWRERLYAAGWTVFLALSLMVEPLDLFWHGLQFPVWYPYRFSFVVCFWFIILAAQALAHLPHGINWWQMVLSMAWSASLTIYVWIHLDNYTYLTSTQVLLTFLVTVGAIILLSLRDDHHHPTASIFFLGLMIIDMASNAVFTLNQLSYVSHSDYHTYTEAVRSGVDRLAQKGASQNDRIGKTVLRAKGDAMQVGYMGTDEFTSLQPKAYPKFYGLIGQSAGDNFVAYTDGTMITDSLLDIKYWLDPRQASDTTNAFLPQVASRPDLQRYTSLGHTRDLNLYQNDNALGLGFAASDQILHTKLYSDSPMLNQETILNDLTDSGYRSLFTRAKLHGPKVRGGSMNSETGSVKKSNMAKTTTVTYTFTAKTTDPYYLQIPSIFTDNLVSLTQNGNTVPLYDTFRDAQLLNVTPSEPNKKQTLTFTLNKGPADFNFLPLYRLDAAGVTADLTQLKQSPWHITARSDRSIAGTISITKNKQLLMTTIPQAPGWRVTVDGKQVTPKKALDFFIAVPLTRGHHAIKLVYTPPYLKAGTLVSAVSLVLLGSWWWFAPHGRHAAAKRRKKTV